MLWLGLAFCALVILFGGRRGALSLLGLAASLAVVVAFIVPAILAGEAPLLVALVGSMAVMLLTISLAHGLGPKSLAAILGTTLSLTLVALLALAFTELGPRTAPPNPSRERRQTASRSSVASSRQSNPASQGTNSR